MAKDLKANLVTDQIIQILRKFMIFDNLEDRDIQKLLRMDATASGDYQQRIVKLRQYEAGETVIQEGEFDSWTYWVVKGIYDVVQNKEVIITLSKPGEIFGEMSVFEGIPRTASVMAVTQGVCLCVDMSVIDTMDDDVLSQSIKNGVYKVILERLARSKEKMMAEKQRLEVKYADLIKFEETIRAKSRR